MTPTKDNTLPPWMIHILTEEEREELERMAQIPLHIQLPIPEERVVEETNDDGDNGDNDTTITEIDIA